MGWSVVQTKSGIHAGRRPAPAPRLRLRGRAIPIYTTQLDINRCTLQPFLCLRLIVLEIHSREDG
jgi:hypothetical protein